MTDDFEGFSTEKNLPVGDSRTDPEDANATEELNCGRWAACDFGRGPVEVRCTVTGDHAEHICQVLFVEEDDEEETDPNLN